MSVVVASTIRGALRRLLRHRAFAAQVLNQTTRFGSLANQFWLDGGRVPDLMPAYEGWQARRGEARRGLSWPPTLYAPAGTGCLSPSGGTRARRKPPSERSGLWPADQLKHQHRRALRKVGRPLSEEGSCLEPSRPVSQLRGNRGEIIWVTIDLAHRPASEPEQRARTGRIRGRREPTDGSSSVGAPTTLMRTRSSGATCRISDMPDDARRTNSSSPKSCRSDRRICRHGQYGGAPSALSRVTPVHRRAAHLRCRRNVFCEPRFPDTGLAIEKDHSALPGECAIEHSAQLRELDLAGQQGQRAWC